VHAGRAGASFQRQSTGGLCAARARIAQSLSERIGRNLKKNLTSAIAELARQIPKLTD